MPEVLALIPARGGSKSLPRKNVLPLGGIPLIAHTIRAAQAAKCVSRVAVSTEDSEIAEIARQYGADVVKRPMELATDDSTSESALLHSLDYLEANEGYLPDILCFLQCTSPFTAPEDIDGVVEALIDEAADSSLSVVRFHHFLWKADETGDLVGVNHDKAIRQRRQDREPEFLETGAVYAMRATGFRAAGHRFFGKTVSFEMPAERVLEIDEPADFALAAARLVTLRARIPPTLPETVEGIVFDFDGVFTDDRVWVDQHGTEAVRCSRRDGLGLEMLRMAGVPMLVISKERNPVVARRCEKLQLEFHQGADSKIDLLRDWVDARGLNPQNVIYVGNDVNDLECMSAVGCPVAPANADSRVLAAAAVILQTDGGEGAIRELADLVLEAIG